MKFAIAGRKVAFVIACCLSAAALTGNAHGAINYLVNSTLDQVDDNPGNGPCHTAANTCTLRAAIMEANRLASPALATILLPAGTYTLSLAVTGANDEFNGDLDLAPTSFGDVVIVLQGAGAATTIIDANQIDRVLEVHPGRRAVINEVTLRNGRVTSGGGSVLGGGGVAVQPTGSLEINDAVVTGNVSSGSFLSSGRGGGISTAGALKIRRSRLSLNSATFGGGIFAFGDANVSIIDTTVNNNSAVSSGGGIFCLGAMTIAQIALTNNSAVFGGGASIGDPGRLVLINSTVAGNSAANSGGGLNVSTRSMVNVYNSTISSNRTDADVSSGAGVFVAGPPDAGILNIRNTIVSGNLSGFVGFFDDCKGLVGSYGHNRFRSTEGCNIVTVDGSWAFLSIGLLGPLQNNGGPTQTIALLPGSNAINAATFGCVDQNSKTLPTDQRGFPRNVGVCDIGAYEFDSLDPDDQIFRNGFE